MLFYNICRIRHINTYTFSVLHTPFFKFFIFSVTVALSFEIFILFPLKMHFLFNMKLKTFFFKKLQFLLLNLHFYPKPTSTIYSKCNFPSLLRRAIRGRGKCANKEHSVCRVDERKTPTQNPPPPHPLKKMTDGKGISINLYK